jgi:hypothetical protein
MYMLRSVRPQWLMAALYIMRALTTIYLLFGIDGIIFSKTLVAWSFDRCPTGYPMYDFEA